MTEQDVSIMLATVVVLLGAIVYDQLDTRRMRKMARRKSSNYHSEAKKEPFELELDSGAVITFKDPNQLDTENAFDMARETDPEKVLHCLLSDDDWQKFWEEWRKRPVGETNALTKDVMEYHGANKS